MLGWLDSFLAGILMALKQPLEAFINLETSDDEFTLVARDGSLVTYIKVHGSRQLVGQKEYDRIVEQATLKLGSRFDKAGYAMQFYFARDPARVRRQIEQMLRPNRSAAKNTGLELDDLFQERINVLEKWLAWEESYIVLWTRPSALSKTEAKLSAQEQKGIQWFLSKDAQYPFSALSALRQRHQSFVTSVQSGLSDVGVQVSKVEVHEALRSVRSSIYPSRANEKWRACLPGDPIPPRAPHNEKDMSDLLWPRLSSQICVGDAVEVDQNTVRIGDMLWSGVDMTLGPMDATPFSELLGRLNEAGIPFRISFLIESGGVEGAAAKTFATSLLAWSSDVNKQIKESIDGLSEMARDEAVVKLRISLSTWAYYKEPKVLETRLATLMQSMESWGYCQVGQMAGDPLEAVMSSAMGAACASTAPPAVVPLYEVMKLLPWQRASSPFEQGANIFRTDDGQIWPYQTGSSLTTTWFDLIFAQPGAGKSVLMNALNLGTCLSAGQSELPYIAVIDIGPSSAGLISLIRDALPSNRRHEAMSFRLRMTPEYSINPFDTQLGCRVPLPDERSYLTELLTLLCTPPGYDKPYDGIPQLCGLVIDEMFRWRNDEGANAEPRPYLPGVDYKVDEALKKLNIKLPEDPYWWDVVDLLFDAGHTHFASMAQRHAAPTLADAVTAARRPQIRALLEDTKIAGGTEGVIQAFERMIASTIRELPILAGVTQFDIGETRVCAIDLGEVAPQGDDNADRQTAIMYMLARHALVRHWWLKEDLLRMVPDTYRAYHARRIKSIAEMPKRMCFDEFHRTSKTRAVRSQVVRDVREGRKWGVQIVLASQLLEDFDDNMVDLATGVWILGAALSDRAVQEARSRFGMTDTAVNVMRNRLTGPRASGAPALLILGTNEGRYEQFLINTLGPVELWALSTSAEDMVIRTRLYERIGAAAARRLLAAHFPGGSARSEINRRIQMALEKADHMKANKSYVIEEIVKELVDANIAQIQKRFDEEDRREEERKKKLEERAKSKKAREEREKENA